MKGILFILFAAIAFGIVWLYQYLKDLSTRSGFKHGFENYYAEIKKALLPYMDRPYMAHVFGKDFLKDEARMCKHYSDQVSRGSVSPWVRELYENRTDHDFVEAYAMMAIIRGAVNCREELLPIYTNEKLANDNHVLENLDILESNMREYLMKKKEKYPHLMGHFYLDEDFFPKELQYKTK